MRVGLGGVKHLLRGWTGLMHKGRSLPCEGHLHAESSVGLRLDCWIAPLVISGVVLSLVSIFASGLVLAAGYACWVWECFRSKRVVLAAPPFTALLAAFLMAVLLSIAFSPDFLASLQYVRKLLKYFAIFLVFTFASREQLEAGYRWIFTVAGASALWALSQFFWFKNVDLMHRIDGFMSHWMTFSGQVMIVGVVLAAYLLVRAGWDQRPSWINWSLPLLLALLGFATLLTFTRSAWLGLAAGCLVLLGLVRIRWVLAGGLALILVFAVLPGSFKSRFYSSFDLSDTTTRGRLELFRAGLGLIEARPWTGVGPRLLQHSALASRQSEEFPDEVYQHLHNNLLQVAAEFGIPAAILWLALWVKIAFDLWRLCGTSDSLQSFAASGALGALAAVQVMGLFEYNFGDSEIAILLMYLVTVPYIVARRSGRPSLDLAGTAQ